MDFLTFKSFISTQVLIIFYYLGAVILPAAIWYLTRWLMRKYTVFNTIYENGKDILWKSLSQKQQTRLALFFILTLFFMELFWRMMFEFLIAYMQIRDALLGSIQ